MSNEELKIEKYCFACGKGLIGTAVICPNCGSPAGNGASSRIAGQGKSKTTAVLLAVFLGFWTYLYTYAEDKVKFWTWLPISSVATILAFNLSSNLGADGFFGELANFLGLGAVLVIVLGSLAPFAAWLIAIVVTASRSSDFFTNYRAK